jgi:ribosomal protein S18 acetylase RimI-like enzyme/predicted nucleic acid-binding protein
VIRPADILLLSSRADVATFLPRVVAAADGERNSFGFLPARAYEDFALQRRLIVACDSNTNALAGYVVFGGTPPQARIFQTYVSPNYRRSGVGRKLVAEVVKRSEEVSFLSIRVEVASDLKEANDFYKNQSFSLVREKSGGTTRKRIIFTRVRELDSPSLLDFATYGGADGPPINLTLSTTTKPPFYLIDLNVLFDLTKRRSNAVGAGRVLAAAVGSSVALAVSSELVAELERNTDTGKPDPILEIARAWPRLKAPSSSVLASYSTKLGPLIFPVRWAAQTLTIQDESDIAHLATAIEEGADGFITSEKAILSCADWFRKNHQLDIISPDVFGKHHTATARSSAGFRVPINGRTVSAGDISQPQIAGVKEFLALREAPDDVAKSAISQGTSTAPRRRLAVWIDEEIVAFGSWSVPKGSDRIIRLYLFANEADPACEIAVDHLLDTAAREASVDQPSVLQINPRSEHILTRSRAMNLGFRPRTGSTSRSGKLEKLCLGSVVTERNWPVLRVQVSILAGIDFPDEPPLFHQANDQITLRSSDGCYASTGLGALEDFVSPAIFALRGRPAVIVPIWPKYAEALFRGSQQPSFLNDERAALMRKRRYFGSARTYGTIPEQGLIFFYESGHSGSGRSAAIALGRVTRRYLAQKDVAEKLSAERGVLSARELKGIAKGEEACVTEFDSVMIFAKPVPLWILKQIGCADNANMVTARTLSSDATLALIEAGQPACAR